MLEGEVSHSCRHGSGPHSIKVCITKNSNDPGLFKRLAAKAGPKPPRRVDVWGHGFAYWLKRQWRRDDPVGLLAGRFRKDPNWSKYRVRGRFERYLTSLGADEDTHRALHIAWEEWWALKHP